MEIGLIDVDGHNGFPNLALMKISAFHKSAGDHVEWWNGFRHYDRVYMSKVFTFTPDEDTVIDADEVIRGGTGYGIYDPLPDHIENAFPDYSIYPDVDYAVGFLTRGCIRKCPWCIVPVKEGGIRKNLSWRQIKRPDSRNLVFLDNNVLASEWGLSQIDDMGGRQLWVDFNQGLDARLITPEIAKMLKRLHWIKAIRMACDSDEMLPVVERAVRYLREVGCKTRIFCYVLVQGIESAHYRAVSLRDMGVDPFAQPYRNFDNSQEPTEEQKRFARWVNHKATFKECRWEDYRG